MTRSIRTHPAATAAVFAPLDGAGRAEVVERRLSDAIVLGLLASGERLPSETELARQFGVATVTAREALESLRGKGLVHTKRGRGGGSFVRSRDDTHADLMAGVLNERVLSMSRVELRDMAVHYSALAAMAAELAADRASADDVDALRRLLDSFENGADAGTPGNARRAENTFRLEVAALSQSARLVREHLRVQAEFGPLLWLNLRTPEHRESGRASHRAVVEAIAVADPDAARRTTVQHIAAAVEWLIELKSEREAGESHEQHD